MIDNFGKVAAPVVGLALALTACASPPPAPYFPASYAPPVYTSDGVYRGTVSYRPAPSPAPPVVQQTPEPAFNPQPVPAPYEQPVDPSCGWWRLCNLWSGS